MSTNTVVIKVTSGKTSFDVHLLGYDTMGVLVERLAAMKEYGKYPTQIVFNSDIVYMTNPGYSDKQNNKLYGRSVKLSDIGITDDSEINIPLVDNVPITMSGEKHYIVIDHGDITCSNLFSIIGSKFDIEVNELTMSERKLKKGKQYVNITSDTVINVNSFNHLDG